MDASLAAPVQLRGPVMGRSDDAELVRRIAGGDRSAFERLYRRYARPVYALALRRLGDRFAAEEAVQETFAAVWRSARTFRADRGAASAWLYAVARNATVDRFRSRAPAGEEPPEVASPAADPAEQAESEWLSWRVHAAVAALPDAERTVLELAYWGGLSQSEIAERLALPLGTVKTRTRSGLARLARELEGEELR